MYTLFMSSVAEWLKIACHPPLFESRCLLVPEIMNIGHPMTSSTIKAAKSPYNVYSVGATKNPIKNNNLCNFVRSVCKFMTLVHCIPTSSSANQRILNKLLLKVWKRDFIKK